MKLPIIICFITQVLSETVLVQFIVVNASLKTNISNNINFSLAIETNRSVRIATLEASNSYQTLAVSICRPGTFWEEQVCKGCPAGQYSNDYAQLFCQNCTAGTYSNRVGMTACIPCPYDYTSTDQATECTISLLKAITYTDISTWGWMMHAMILSMIVYMCVSGSKKMWVRSSIKHVLNKISIQMRRFRNIRYT